MTRTEFPKSHENEGLPAETLSNAFASYKLRDDFLSLNPPTRLAYSTDLNQLQENARTQGVSEIRKLRDKHVNAWIDSLRNTGVREATIARKKVSVRSFLRWADKEGFLGFQLGPEYQISTEASAPLLPQQVSSLLSNAESLRDKVLIECFLSTGESDKDIASLTGRDIVETDGKIVINFRGMERKASRTVEIEEEYAEDFRRYKKQFRLKDSDNFFPRRARRKENMTRQGFHNILRKYKKHTGGRLNTGMLRKTHEKNSKAKKNQS